jgi:hypothetical protein
MQRTADGKGRIYEDGSVSWYHLDEIANPIVTSQPLARSGEALARYLAESWAALDGEHQALGEWVLVRTEPARRSTDSGILLPTDLDGFYGGLPKGRYAYATVLSVGSACAEVTNQGDSVLFPRMHFARWKVLRDGSLIGWIHESEVTLTVSP